MSLISFFYIVCSSAELSSRRVKMEYWISTSCSLTVLVSEMCSGLCLALFLFSLLSFFSFYFYSRPVLLFFISFFLSLHILFAFSASDSCWPIYLTLFGSTIRNDEWVGQDCLWIVGSRDPRLFSLPRTSNNDVFLVASLPIQANWFDSFHDSKPIPYRFVVIRTISIPGLHSHQWFLAILLCDLWQRIPCHWVSFLLQI